MIITTLTSTFAPSDHHLGYPSPDLGRIYTIFFISDIFQSNVSAWGPEEEGERPVFWSGDGAGSLSMPGRCVGLGNNN